MQSSGYVCVNNEVERQGKVDKSTTPIYVPSSMDGMYICMYVRLFYVSCVLCAVGSKEQQHAGGVHGSGLHL